MGIDGRATVKVDPFLHQKEYAKQKFEERLNQILNNTDFNQRTRIFQAISNERSRQDFLHGSDLGEHALAILGEEYGEVCRSMFEGKPENLKEELIHVAAVAVRWLEELEV